MVGNRKIVGLWRATPEGQAETSGDAPDSGVEMPLDGVPDRRPALDDAPVFSPRDWDGDRAGDEFDDSRAIASGVSARWTGALSAIAAAWTLFIGWTASDGGQVSPAAAAIPDIVVQWTVPLVLIGLVWLGVQRSSLTEAARYARATRALRIESDRVNERLSAMTAHLHDAQAKLVAQADLLTGYGMDAARRLHDSSAGMAGDMERAVTASAAMHRAGDAARTQIEGLLSNMPRIADVAGRVADTLREAGLSAHQHGAALEAQMTGMVEVGHRVAAMAGDSAERLDQSLEAVEARGLSAAATLERLFQRLDRQTQELTQKTRGSVAHLVKAMGDARSMGEVGIEAVSDAAITRFAESDARMSAALGRLAQDVASISEALDAQGDRTARLAQSLRHDIDAVEQDITALDASGIERFGRLAETIALAENQLRVLNGSVESGTASAETLTSRAEAMLIALDAVTRELDESLPRALERLDGNLAHSNRLTAELAPQLDRSEMVAAATAGQLRAGADMLAEQQRTAGALHLLLAEIDQVGQDFTATRAPDMAAAVDRVRQAASAAMLAADQQIGEAVDRGVNRLRDATAHHLTEAVQGEVEARLEDIVLASERAVAAAQGATDRLMRQMITIMDTSAQIEQRAAEAEAAIAGSDRDTIARQATLLTDSLKSIAIDITKILSTEVTDTAWESYLKGDRGVFARRAVRLIDNQEGRDILRQYEGDEEFRDHVNRFIHDFEAMLRLLMGTRSGSSLSVTLLSSDIGKLYVALAQAIDRLRT